MDATQGLFVDSLIIHEVPQPSGGGAGPVMSEVPSTLTDDLRNYFREKIIRSLDRGAEVVRDERIASPVPDELLRSFQDMTAFVGASQEMARFLYTTQTRVNPAGLLVLIRATVGDGDAAVVLKLEKEGAVRVHREQVNGRATFRVTHLDDLTLGQHTRVFKTGLFPRFERAKRMAGLVRDEQRGYGPVHEVAHFFLSTFLGCKLREAPEERTRRFFEAAQEFINTEVRSPDTKATYEVALLAEMQAQVPQLDPRSFASRHFARADAQRFVQYLETEGIAPQVFDKDTSRVATRIAQMALETTEGIRVSGPRTAWQKSVAVEEHTEGRARITVDGAIKHVGR